MKSIPVFIFLAFLTGCATHSNEITPAYVPATKYNEYSCNQVKLEEEKLSRKINELAGIVNKEATNATSGQVAAGLIFFPALLFNQQDKRKAEALSELLGEYEALEKASIEKSCDVRFKSLELDPKS